MSNRKLVVPEKTISLDEMIQASVRSDPEFAARYEATRVKREFAEMLIGARSRAGLSASVLAARAGWDRATVSRLESANGPVPEAETIARYLEACGKELRLGYVVVDSANNRIADVLEISKHGPNDRFLRPLKGREIDIAEPEAAAGSRLGPG